LGILGLMSLPVEEYPEIAPPTVQVSATYTGANAETVLNSVVIPLEEEINGVEGMTYMASTAITVLQIFLFTLDWEQILISLR
jgi:HAE1 family hydrophobic/amphiphilic exporter-1